MAKIIPRFKPTIDQPIYQTVLDLNESGLPTEYSCSGHSQRWNAYIQFRRLLTTQEKELAETILQQHRNTRITFRYRRSLPKYGRSSHTLVTFTRPFQNK